MTHCVLLWALPDSWTQFDLLAPDLAERIDDEMRQRFQGSGIPDEDLQRVIGLQIEGMRSSAEDGVVLLASKAQGSSDPGQPPPGLSLSLALAAHPESESAAATAGQGQPESDRPGNAAASYFEPTPLVLEDPELTAFTKETRDEIAVPGAENPLSSFQVQAFVLPKEQPVMAVVTVTTFSQGFEDAAREAARTFASTLRFVIADDDE